MSMDKDRSGLYEEPNTDLYGLPATTEKWNDMPYQMLGKSGLQVSNIGLGTWKFGYPDTGDGARCDRETAFEIFDRAIELGVTFWDTANRYNNSAGNSERIIGDWLKENPKQRRNIVLATKIYGCMDGDTPNHWGLSRTNVLEATYACLERMRTDYIDLLYFHFPDGTTPIEESLEVLEDLVRQDLVRYVAISNFSVEDIKTYMAALNNYSYRVKPVAVQNHYDIIRGESEVFGGEGVLDYTANHDLSFVAWSPLARGLLTERYLDVDKVGEGDRLYDEGEMEEKVTEENLKKLKKLTNLAHDWDLTLTQMTLAYMLTIPGMGPIIPGASKLEQLESNAEAGKVELSREQVFKIKEALEG